MFDRRSLLKAASFAALAKTRVASAQTMPGVTATEIKIGNTMPYSGPGSAYGVIGKTEAAVFRMINDCGGINGRQINFISLDDAYSPPKTVEQTRRLVEQEGVALLFSGLGTAAQLAVRPYLNAAAVPQLFIATGAEKFADPQHYPWTLGFQPSFLSEAMTFATYIQREKPGAKIGILYQNDDSGKDYQTGLKRGLGDRSSAMLIAEASYEATDATIDSQIMTLQAAGIDVLVSASTPKFGAQTIRKLADLNFRPLHLISTNSNSVGAVLVPAGPEKAIGLISTCYMKDNTDPRWADDPGMTEWRTFMAKYVPDADLKDRYQIGAYAASLALVHVLQQCGNDLTRENIMRQATNIHDLRLPTLLPGSLINTSPTNYHPIRARQMQRFNGKSWELFGSLIST